MVHVSVLQYMAMVVWPFSTVPIMLATIMVSDQFKSTEMCIAAMIFMTTMLAAIDAIEALSNSMINIDKARMSIIGISFFMIILYIMLCASTAHNILKAYAVGQLFWHLINIAVSLWVENIC